MRCDDARVGGPVVRWNPVRNLWSLWYYARSRRFAADLAPAFGSGCIALAESKDGKSWHRVDGPASEQAVMAPRSMSGADEGGAFDAGHIGTGDVIAWRGGWLMAYFGGNDEIPQDCAPLYAHAGYVLRIGLAFSDDGMNWRRLLDQPVAGPTLDEVYAGFPGLVSDDDDLYLHYTVVDRLGRYYQTRMLTSRDGISWQKVPAPFFEADAPLHETGGIITRDIQRCPDQQWGRWLMVYTARDGRPETAERRSIGAAVSDDLYRWRRLWDEPIFTAGIRGAWDSAGVANPRLIVTDAEYRLYYYGWSNDSAIDHPRRGIGLALSARESGAASLRTWRRAEISA